MGVHHLLPEFRRTLFSLLCLLFFTLYAGPNVATYVLPVVSFPQDVRSTFHGMSSAAAKVGAMLGALFFPIMDAQLGITAVITAQAIVCLAGALLSCFFLNDQEILREVLPQDEGNGDRAGLRMQQLNIVHLEQENENAKMKSNKMKSKHTGRATDPFE